MERSEIDRHVANFVSGDARSQHPDWPILSIVVPSYNVKQYLEWGLTTYADVRFNDILEVLVVNDGSTDSTPEIACDFEARYPRIFRVIDKENGGHGSTINVALALAQGKYFRIVDGDDWVDTEALVELIDVLQNADVDVVVDVRTDVDMSSGEETLRPFSDKVPKSGEVPFDDICLNADAIDAISIHTLTCKTQFLRDQHITLLEKTFYEDYEYIVKATLRAKSILFVNVAVYHYLLGNSAQSVSDGNFVRRWDDHTRVTEEILRVAKDAQQLSDPRREYARRKADLLINTHYKIALIFDADRKRGVKRAKDFRRWLRREYPDFARRTEKRYHLTRMLHRLGIDSQDALDRFTGR